MESSIRLTPNKSELNCKSDLSLSAAVASISKQRKLSVTPVVGSYNQRRTPNEIAFVKTRLKINKEVTDDDIHSLSRTLGRPKDTVKRWVKEYGGCNVS